MKTIAIIQARMGSTRLPGKVLMDIGGCTMLARAVRRTERAKLLDEVVVATTINESDDVIIEECVRLGVATFRGSVEDVLDRYYRAAQWCRAEVVVRITSDCPLIDPEIIDQVVNVFLTQECDYASNSIERAFPRGLDTEVMSTEALTRAWSEAKESYERVHVTPYLHRNPRLFRLLSVKADADYSMHRWTVDVQQDLDLVRQIYARLGNADTFSWRDAIALLNREPELADTNCNVRQKDLKED